MDQSSSFADILEAVDRLSRTIKRRLLEIVRRRVAERGRERVAEDVRASRLEFEQGKARSVTVDELMDELLS